MSETENLKPYEVYALKYEANPLESPRCQGPMRVITLIDNPALVRRILEHLGRWTRFDE